MAFRHIAFSSSDISTGGSNSSPGGSGSFSFSGRLPGLPLISLTAVGIGILPCIMQAGYTKPRNGHQMRKILAYCI